MFRFLLNRPSTWSNRLPWEQTLPHQNLPLKKDITISVSIMGITSKPNLGHHSPPTATKRVKGQVYFCSLAAPYLMLEVDDTINTNLPIFSVHFIPLGGTSIMVAQRSLPGKEGTNKKSPVLPGLFTHTGNNLGFPAFHIRDIYTTNYG